SDDRGSRWASKAGGVVLVQAQPARADKATQLAREADASGLPVDVHDGDLAKLTGPCERAQYPHHGGDATAGRDEQQGFGAILGQREVAGGLAEEDDSAGCDATNEVRGDDSAARRLDRDRDRAARGVRRRRQRIGALVADAVDLDADRDVLAGAMAPPSGSRPDRDGGAVSS